MSIPAVTAEPNNAAYDVSANQWNGLLGHGLEREPYFIVRQNGADTEVIQGGGTSGAGTIVYGGASDTGGVDGGDASAVINAALANLPAGRTWKEKVLIKGNYTDLTKITVPSYTIMQLQGKLKAVADLNMHFIYAANASYIEIYGGEIDPNGANQTAAMDGIYFDTVTYSDIHDLTIQGACRVAAADGESIELDDCGYCNVYNIHGFLCANSYDHIKMSGTTTKCIVSNCNLDGTNGSGNSDAIQSATGTTFNKITGNLIYCPVGSSSNGVKLHSANYCVISDNIIIGALGKGIALIDNANYNQIIGNTIYNPAYAGILFVDAIGGADSYYNVIENNYIYLSATDNVRGILLAANARNTYIQNNTVIGQAATNVRGISILASATDTIIKGNNLSHSQLDVPLLDLGTATTMPITEFLFLATGTFGSWNNMPLALTEYLGFTYHRKAADLTQYIQARIVTTVSATGTAGSTFAVQYSLDNGVNWAYIDASAGPSCTGFNSTGVKVSDWVTIAQAARTSVLIRIVGSGGDGAADPGFNEIALQVR